MLHWVSKLFWLLGLCLSWAPSYPCFFNARIVWCPWRRFENFVSFSCWLILSPKFVCDFLQSPLDKLVRQIFSGCRCQISLLKGVQNILRSSSDEDLIQLNFVFVHRRGAWLFVFVRVTNCRSSLFCWCFRVIDSILTSWFFSLFSLMRLPPEFSDRLSN